MMALFKAAQGFQRPFAESARSPDGQRGWAGHILYKPALLMNAISQIKDVDVTNLSYTINCFLPRRER